MQVYTWMTYCSLVTIGCSYRQQSLYPQNGDSLWMHQQPTPPWLRLHRLLRRFHRHHVTKPKRTHLLPLIAASLSHTQLYPPFETGNFLTTSYHQNGRHHMNYQQTTRVYLHQPFHIPTLWPHQQRHPRCPLLQPPPDAALSVPFEWDRTNATLSLSINTSGSVLIAWSSMLRT